MHVKGRRRTYKVLTERPHLVHRLKPRCFLLWCSINRCTTMPAFTGSVNPNLSYKSLVNMGQKARKHWAHAFMWMLLWFHPLKMLLQGTEHCALLSPNTGTLWVYVDGQFRGVWKRSCSPCSNGSHTYLIDISEFLLTTACPHLPTPYLEFLRAQSLVQRCILYICYLWVI